jgi:hypothetical protein
MFPHGQLMDELFESLMGHLQIAGQEEPLGHDLGSLSLGSSMGHANSKQAADRRGDHISWLSRNSLKFLIS